MNEDNRTSYSVSEAMHLDLIALTTRGLYEPLIEGVHIYVVPKEGSFNDDEVGYYDDGE